MTEGPRLTLAGPLDFNRLVQPLLPVSYGLKIIPNWNVRPAFQ